jgi:hypothetical protein
MDVEWLLYKLIHNDSNCIHATLDIDYYDDDVWERLIPSLRGNHTLTSLKVCRAETIDTLIRTVDEIRELFGNMRQVPLRELSLVNLSATALEESGLAELLTKHETLERVELILGEGEEQESAQLSNLLPRALGTTQCLQKVSLELSTSIPLASFLNSQTLQELTVECLEVGGVFEDHDILPMLQALETNTTLKSLDLEHSISELGMVRVAQMLTHNTTLRSLQLSFSTNGHPNDGDNPSKNSDHVWRSVINALKQNASPSLARLVNYKASQAHISVPAIPQALLELLDGNYSLTDCCLFHPESFQVLMPTIQLYFKLNRAGRGRLLQTENVPKSWWVDMLIQVRDDLDCLLYFLSRNPSLCQIAPLPTLCEQTTARSSLELQVSRESEGIHHLPAPPVPKKIRRSY